MRTISIRIDEKLGDRFDRICRQSGYKKTTLISRLIAAFVRHQGATLSRRSKRRADPFAATIGLLKLEPLLDSLEAIDSVVYDL